jgi:hypothetical protein
MKSRLPPRPEYGSHDQEIARHRARHDHTEAMVKKTHVTAPGR